MAIILHLESEKDIGDLVQAALGEHQVDTLPNSKEAFSALNNGKKYELLIVEPYLGTAAYTLAKLARARNLPVIYLTVMQPRELTNSTVPSAYVSKPFDPEYLKTQVRTLLTGNGSAGSAEKKT